MPTPTERPDSPEEAAKAFEKVLVRRFVKTMTEKMFDSPLSGSDGPGWMNGQRDQQRDMLTDVLADHIVESDSLRIRDLLLRDWGVDTDAPTAPAQDDADPVPSALPGPLDARPTAPIPHAGRPLKIS
jgi:flagellar protein FlgJ